MLGDRTSGSFSPHDLRTLLRSRESLVSNVVKTSSGVVIQKPWWMSKKNLLTLLALGLALYQSYSGKWENLTPEQLAAKIAETATWLGPILGMILALAKVDASTRSAAILADAVEVAKSLDDKDPPVGGSSDGVRPS